MLGRLPRTPRQLRRQLFWTLSVAGTAVAALAATVAYVATARHVETLVAGKVMSGISHFSEGEWTLDGSGDAHGALVRMLDRDHFVGVRVRDADGRVITEVWADGLDPALRAAAQRAGSRTGGSLLRADGEAFVRITRPVTGGPADGASADALYRLDPTTVHVIDPQARDAALTSALAVAATALLLYPVLLGLTRRALGLSQDLLRSNLELMRALGSAIALRDSDTDAHNYRVTLYAVALAEAIGMPASAVADLIAGAFLHDIGKIGIPDAILRKPAPLSDQEFLAMQQHPLLGEGVISQSAWLARALPVVRHHHERYDGSGYPDGLAGDRIPLPARVFAIADVFDALTSERPYKRALPLDQALEIMGTQMSGKLDPGLLRRWLEMAPGCLDAIGGAAIGDLQRELSGVVQRYFVEPAGE